MAKSYTYLVSFNRAERTPRGFYWVTFDMASPSVRHEVVASSFPALESEVRRLALEFGQTCSPYIRLKDQAARKPAGFDAFTETLNIIDVEPVTAGEG